MKEGIVLSQAYARELKQLMIDQRSHNHPKRKKKAHDIRNLTKTGKNKFSVSAKIGRCWGSF